LWLSALAAFNNCQLPDQFTSSEQLKPAAAQWFCLFQEALINRSENNDSSSFLPVTKKSILAAPKSAQVQQEAVQVYSLDDVFNDIVSPDDTILLKLDVQGYEEQVIKGARKSINLIKAALLEVSIVPMYENQATYLAIISMMGDLGFHPFAFFKGYCNEKKVNHCSLISCF
jgi:FkbM family methyltransferase